MHGPRSQNAPERGADQCEQPDGAGRWCRQMVPVASYNRHGALHTAKTRRAQALHADAPCNHYAQTLGAALRAIAQRNRSRKRSAHSLGAALRANARHIRSTTRWNSRAGPHGEGVFATNAGFLANFVDFWRWTSTIRRQEDLVSHVRAPLPTLLACFYS